MKIMDGNSKKWLLMNSHLERHMFLILPFAVISFLLCEYGIVKFSNSLNICQERLPFPDWVRGVNFGAAFALSSNGVLQTYFSLKYIVQKQPEKSPLLAMHLAILTVHFIAGVSQYITFFELNQGVCVDGFRVYSLASHWAEWLVSVPLLAYLSCGVVNKASLGWMEWLLIADIACMILMGFLIILDPGRRYLYFVSSCVNLLVVPCLSRFISQQDLVAVCSHRLENLSTKSETSSYLISQQQRWRGRMLGRFFVVCLCFPAIYLLAAVGYLDPAQTCAAFLLGSLLGKLLFSSTLAESYLSLCDRLQSVSWTVQRTSSQRQTWLRYVFHEVRTPLNSLALGMQLLDELLPANLLPLEDHSVLSTMQSSLASLVDSVNQVLALHRLKDGELQLQPLPVVLGEWWTQCLLACQPALTSQRLQYILQVDARLADRLVALDGDRWQLLVYSLLTSLSSCLTPGGCLYVWVSDQPPARWRERGIAVRPCCKEKRGGDKEEGDGKRGKGPLPRLSSLLWMSLQQSLWTLFNLFFSNLVLFDEEEGDEGEGTGKAGRRRGRGRGRGRQQLLQREEEEEGDGEGQQQKEQEEQLQLFISFASPDYQLSVEQLRLLFEPFQQLRTAPQQAQHGSGLGIVLASELLYLHEAADMQLLRAVAGREGGRGERGEPGLMQEVLLSCRLQLLGGGGARGVTWQQQQPSHGSYDSSYESSYESSYAVPLAMRSPPLPPPSSSPLPSPAAARLPRVPSTAMEQTNRHRGQLPGEGEGEEGGEEGGEEDHQPAQQQLPLLQQQLSALSLSRMDTRLASWEPSSSSSSLHHLDLQPELLAEAAGSDISSSFKRERTPMMMMRGGGREGGAGAMRLRSLSSHSGGGGDRGQTAAPVSAAAASSASSASFSLQILVVDDTPSNLKMLVHTLSKKGHRCMQAADGQQALGLVQQQGLAFFDLIFLDNTMPVMSGVDASHHLRRLGCRQPILGVTGNVLDHDLEAFLAAGADAVLLKPLKVHEMDLLLAFFQQTGLLSDPASRLQIVGQTVQRLPRLLPYETASPSSPPPPSPPSAV